MERITTLLVVALLQITTMHSVQGAYPQAVVLATGKTHTVKFTWNPVSKNTDSLSLSCGAKQAGPWNLPLVTGLGSTVMEYRAELAWNHKPWPHGTWYCVVTAINTHGSAHSTAVQVIIPAS